MPAAFFPIFITFGVIMNIAFAVTPTIIIRVLRSQRVRSALKSAAV